MSVELAQIAAGLPFAMSLAGAGGTRLVRQSRRRVVLNEALHELRRPLQALALALSPEAESAPAVASSLQLAVAALGRLDREINGGLAVSRPERVEMKPLLETAAARWGRPAAAAGGSLRMRWRTGAATVLGDALELAQAVDNMIINGLEHGGPEILLEGAVRGPCLHVSVSDGGSLKPGSPCRGLREELVRVSGRRRRGHGLRVVRRVAAAHGGAFSLRRSAGGAESVLVLPLAPGSEG